MGKIVLVTGGCRSGKSEYARQRAEGLDRPRCYLATCPVRDEEMARRVERHRAARAKGNWRTIEEETDLARVLGGVPPGIVVVDCLTLWLSNLMFAAGRAAKPFGEDEAAAAAGDVVRAARAYAGQVLLITNEVGLGIVPENDLARRFRDLAGRCNQTVAAAADEVIFMVSGIPMIIKGAKS